jgi:hypothetical protein
VNLGPFCFAEVDKQEIPECTRCKHIFSAVPRFSQEEEKVLKEKEAFTTFTVIIKPRNQYPKYVYMCTYIY